MQRVLSVFACLFVGLLIISPVVVASEISEIKVYKNPHCGCCNKWISYLKDQGFTVKSENNSMLPAMKEAVGVTSELASCHTAVVDGYVLEGHVPAEDVKRLVEERPDIKGLTVPGMPIGSPGMEQGDTKERYDVIAIKKDGSTYVYSTHNDSKD
jgi:hypothetical protein